MSTRVTRGFPPQYKQSRLRAWEGNAPYWSEYILRDDFHWKSHEQIFNGVLRHLAPSGPGPYSLCDLGCGSGALLETARKDTRVHWKRLVGVDFSRQMLHLAREKDVSRYPRLRYREVDLESGIDAGNAPHLKNFDAGIAAFVIDEVEKLEPCLATAASMLRPGGYLVSGTLDCEREFDRYREQIKAAGEGPEPLVLTKTHHGDTFRGTYYRILREVREIDCYAARQGLCLIENKVISPTELRSRPTGPALRLLIWQRCRNDSTSAT